jgi:hypothetical protein
MNTVKLEIHLHNKQMFSSYLTVNTLHLSYKGKSINAAQIKYNWSLLQESHKTHTVRGQNVQFGVTAFSSYSCLSTCNV